MRAVSVETGRPEACKRAVSGREEMLNNALKGGANWEGADHVSVGGSRARKGRSIVKQGRPTTKSAAAGE